jgi:tetratricopeptide (TPR) repeat protein
MMEQEVPETKAIANEFWSAATRIACLYLACLFISYCIMYLCACPSAALAGAIGAEILALLVSVTIWRTKLLSLPARLTSMVPDHLRTLLAQMRASVDCGRFMLLSLAAVLATIDFGALTYSALGFTGPSIALYSALPTSYFMGLHPAFTLEMLAGAFVQNKQLDRAEPLYRSVLQVRINVCGARSDQVGAIYADLGDLYVRMNNLREAEAWYRKSVALGARTGRAYTALATVLRETGRYEESRQFYERALKIRKQIYGIDSKQYVDTLRSYDRLRKILPELSVPAV